MKTDNSLFQITVFRRNGTWVFNDPARNLVEEPFVLGANDIISKLRKRNGIRKKKVTITFSEVPIPTYDTVLTVVHAERPIIKAYQDKHHQTIVIRAKTGPFVSAWYKDSDGDECWLCPAQLKYFNRVARTIFVKVT